MRLSRTTMFAGGSAITVVLLLLVGMIGWEDGNPASEANGPSGLPIQAVSSQKPAFAKKEPALPQVLEAKKERVRPGRDPFAPSSRMRAKEENRLGDLGFSPAKNSVSMPKLILRGYIEIDKKPPAALLEVLSEGTYLVRSGDTISIFSRGKNTVLKVKDVSRLSTIIEIGTIGQLIVVR